MAKNADLLHHVPLLLIFLCLLIVLFIPIRTPFYYYDEGFAVFNATRVMGGEIPYKDFWAIYPPGQLYVLASLYKAFGVSLLISRIYDTLVRFTIVVGVYAIARQITSPILALASAFAATLVLTSVSFYAYAVYPALAFSLWAIVCTVEYFYKGQKGWLLLTGVLAGLAGLFRFDIGLYASASLGISIFLLAFLSLLRKTGNYTDAFVPAANVALLPVMAAFGLMVFGYGLVGLFSGFNNLWEQVFLFPFTKLHDVRWRPYPALIPAGPPDFSAFLIIYSEAMDWVRFYLPVALYLPAIIYEAHALLWKHQPVNRRTYGTFAVTIYGPFLFAQALSRYDYIHVLPTMILAILVFASLYDDLVFRPVHWVMKLVLVALLPLLFAAYFTAPINTVFTTLDDFAPWGCFSQIHRASCVYLSSNQQQAVRYVQTHTQENQPIYVGNQRHDIVFINDVGFYFLSARASATRYSELHPGVATTLPVQKQIAAEIDRKNVDTLVLVDIPNSGEPNASSVSSGIHYLDDYIRSRYFVAATFGEYQIWHSMQK
jgi:hypothetical protein